MHFDGLGFALIYISATFSFFYQHRIKPQIYIKIKKQI